MMAERRTRRAASDSEEAWRGYIAHGSKEHAAFLGLGTEELSDEAVKTDPVAARERARLERQLKTKPSPASTLERKLPVMRENYAPTDRDGRGDEIIDGWTRKGR